jgi:hypothetical protein
MPRATLNVRSNARGETILDVHRWPAAGTVFVCSSICASREPDLLLDPEWCRPDDAAQIHRRLAPATDQTSGADKGRVLYAIEPRPLAGGLRTSAAALLSVDGRALRLFRLCFSAEVPTVQQPVDATLLVECARELAATGGQQLQMLVPPNARPGDVAAQFGFANGTTSDRFRQIWVR